MDTHRELCYCFLFMCMRYFIPRYLFPFEEKSSIKISNFLGYTAWLTTLFVTCVKFSFTVAFFMIWLQAMEVYPTCVRQTGTSIGGLVSNIFGILGPYVVYLVWVFSVLYVWFYGHFFKGTAVDGRLPYVVLLCLAILGGFCSSLLPETLNKKLPETLEDVKNFGDVQKFWSFNVTKNNKNKTDEPWQRSVKS